MSTIRPMNEDRYIAHLAGLSHGNKNSPISGYDKHQASRAQNHPISNGIFSIIGGSIYSTAITTFGVLAVPFLQSSVRESVLGSNVCMPCVENTKIVTETAASILKNIFVNVSPYINERSKTISYILAQMPTFVSDTITSFANRKFDDTASTAGWLAGGIQATACATDAEVETQCRILNYEGNLINTLSENFTTIAAVAVGIAVLRALSHHYNYTQDEQKAGNNVKDSLSQKYLQIASRLKNLEVNDETKMIAKNILNRQLSIHKEIKSLDIPNLSWREIEYITLPVLLAAKDIVNQETSKETASQKG